MVETKLDIKKENCSINLLKFIFAMFICFIHFIRELWLANYNCNVEYCFAGGICVELFFIISGYYLFFTKKNTFEYIKQRIIRLYPLLIFSTLFVAFLRPLKIANVSLSIEDVYNLLFLQGTGIFQGCGLNGPAWFICVLFWVSIFYYLLKKYLNPKIFFIILTIIVVLSFLLLWLPDQNGYAFLRVRGFTDIKFISVMLTRGLLSMGVGLMIAWFQTEFKKLKYEPCNKSKIALTFCEITLFIALLMMLMMKTSNMSYRNIYIIINIIFIPLFFLFVNKLGYLSSNIFNKKIFNILGAYAFSIYMMNESTFWIIRYIFKKSPELVNNLPNVITYIGGLTIFIILGVFAYYCNIAIVKLINSVATNIRNNMNIIIDGDKSKTRS